VYTSNETGQFEVYVTRFPTGEGKWPISVNGGFSPQWSEQSSEIFYVGPDQTMMVVPVEPHSTFQVPLPKSLFSADGVGVVFSNRPVGGPVIHSYTVTSDGQRFVMVQYLEGENQASPTITLVQDWAAKFAGQE
jgi:hypothetical protein